MNTALSSRNPDLPPRSSDVAATANAPVADNPRDGRPKLVALAFDANGHYSYTMITHAVDDTLWDDAA